MDNNSINSSENINGADIPASPVNNSVNGAKPPKKKKKKKIIIIGIVVVILLILGRVIFGGGPNFEGLSTSKAGNSSREGTYTLMVYMVGSNLESEGAMASKDISEMMTSGIDPRNTNVIIYAGGAKTWWIDVQKDNKNYLKLDVDANGNLSLKKLTSEEPRENMAEPAALSSFINYCTDNYPADNYGLVFWDHGGGPAFGYGQDELSDDMLEMQEADEAMKNTIFASEKKLDFVGYDACLMASVEIAQIWDNYANYMVASEETEAGYGWNYAFLNTFNETADPVKVGESICDNFAAFYDANRSKYSNQDYTLSVMDLSQISALSESVAALLDSISVQVETGDLSAVTNSATPVKEFAKGEAGLVDLGDLVNKLSATMPEETAAVKSSIEKVVIKNTVNIDSAGGVSLYYPFHTFEMLQEQNSKFTFEYADVINGIKNGMKTRSIKLNTDWKLGDVKTEGENAVVTLSDKQQKDFSSAYFSVFSKFNSDLEDEKNKDVYVPVLLESPVTLGNDGKLQVPLAPQVMTINSVVNDETTNKSVFTTTQIDADSYASVRARLWNAGELQPFGDYMGVELTMTAGDDGVVINNVAADKEDDFLVNGRATVDVSEWGYIGNTYDSVVSEKGEYVLKDTDGTVYWNYMSTGDNIEFKLSPTTELDGEYFAQLVVVDLQGNKHVTGLIDLKNMYNSIKLSETKTENGSIKFHVYNDHAELYEYTGSDTKVTVPETVEGKKVTAVCGAAFGSDVQPNETISEIVLPESITKLYDSAFMCVTKLEKINIPSEITVIPDDCFFKCLSLAEITLPEKVSYIGNFAFWETSMKTFDFPKNVEFIGKAPVGNTELESITIGGGNKGKNYKIENNLLLSHDGKTLHYGIVDKNSTSLAVPKGVETIADYALCNAFNEPFPYSLWAENKEAEPHVTKLELPDGLKRIGDFAFCGCIALDELSFPDSLEYIGDSAFASYTYQSGSTIETLKIGANVKTIEFEAFNGYIIKSFEVDPANERYSSVNGKLANKGGDNEIKVSYQEESQEATE